MLCFPCLSFKEILKFAVDGKPFVTKFNRTMNYVYKPLFEVF